MCLTLTLFSYIISNLYFTWLWVSCLFSSYFTSLLSGAPPFLHACYKPFLWCFSWVFALLALVFLHSNGVRWQRRWLC